MPKEHKGPKILYLDIETAPHKVYAWGLFKQNIAINQIQEPGYTLCFAAKWHHRPKQKIFKSVHHDGADVMIQTMWDLLDEADAVVHYNGKKFDMPTLNREFLLFGLAPPSDYFQIDLYQVVSRTFRFASNKLDYVSQQLGIGAKVSHKGMELWDQCMTGDEKAWRVMKRYNLQDTDLLPLLYERLLPWINQHPNLGLWEDSVLPTCPNCGSTHLERRGTRKTRVTVYPRYKCLDCGRWSRGRKRDRKTSEGILT